MIIFSKSVRNVKISSLKDLIIVLFAINVFSKWIIIVYKFNYKPWINNCVGHYNLRYFVLMLLWTNIGAIFMSYFHILILIKYKNNVSKYNKENRFKI